MVLTPFEWFLVGIGFGLGTIVLLVFVLKAAIRRFPATASDPDGVKRDLLRVNPGLAILVDQLERIESQLKALEATLERRNEPVSAGRFDTAASVN